MDDRMNLHVRYTRQQLPFWQEEHVKRGGDADKGKDDTDDREAGSSGGMQTASGQKRKSRLKSVAQPAAKSAKTGLNPKVGGEAKKKVKSRSGGHRQSADTAFDPVSACNLIYLQCL